MLEKVKIKGLIKIFAMACFCTFTVLYVPYMSLIRIRICISPNGSGYYYTNPDPRIWIPITGSSLAVYGCISGDPDPFCSSDRPDRPPFRISWRGETEINNFLGKTCAWIIRPKQGERQYNYMYNVTQWRTQHVLRPGFFFITLCHLYPSYSPVLQPHFSIFSVQHLT